MVATRVISCFLFCSVMVGCSSLPNRTVSDLCSIKFGPRGSVSLDMGDSCSCDVDPNEEKIKSIDHLRAGKSNELDGAVGMKVTWKF